MRRRVLVLLVAPPALPRAAGAGVAGDGVRLATAGLVAAVALPVARDAVAVAPLLLADTGGGPAVGVGMGLRRW